VTIIATEPRIAPLDWDSELYLFERQPMRYTIATVMTSYPVYKIEADSLEEAIELFNSGSESPFDEDVDEHTVKSVVDENGCDLTEEWDRIEAGDDE
jgi:hypothetical protein